MTPLDQLLDQPHDLSQRLAGQGLGVGPPQAEPVGVGPVGGGQVGGQLVAGHAALARGHVDLVVDVRDVRHERHVVSLVGQEALEQREDDVRARVADVDAVVDRRAAGVDADLAGSPGFEGLELAREGVVQYDRPHVAGRLPGFAPSA
jgi:hypothetical protein